MHGIRMLSMRGHELMDIPDNLAMINGLESIDLSENLISVCSPRLGRNKNLAVLRLNRNKLQSLPYEWSDMAALVELCLSGNEFAEVPGPVPLMWTLKKLDLSHNRLRSIESALPATLEHLDLSHNELREVGHAFDRGLTALTFLSLAANPISSLAEVRELTALTSLSVAETKVSVLPGDVCASLTKLVSLDLGRTPLRTLPPQVTMLGALNELRVGNLSLGDSVEADGPFTLMLELCRTVQHPLIVRSFISLASTTGDERVDVLRCGGPELLASLLESRDADKRHAALEAAYSLASQAVDDASRAATLQGGLLEALGVCVADAGTAEKGRLLAAATLVRLCMHASNHTRLLVGGHGGFALLSRMMNDLHPPVASFARQAAQDLAAPLPLTAALTVCVLEAMSLYMPGEGLTPPRAPIIRLAIDNVDYTSPVAPTGAGTAFPSWLAGGKSARTTPVKKSAMPTPPILNPGAAWRVGVTNPQGACVEVQALEYKNVGRNIVLGVGRFYLGELLSGGGKEMWLKLYPPAPGPPDQSVPVAKLHLSAALVPVLSPEADVLTNRPAWPLPDAWKTEQGLASAAYTLEGVASMPVGLGPPVGGKASFEREDETGMLYDLLKGDDELMQDIFRSCDASWAVYFDVPKWFKGDGGFSSVQWANRHSVQRYLLAEGTEGGVVYAAFMGTYSSSDAMTDLKFTAQGSTPESGRLHAGIAQRVDTIPLLPFLDIIRPPKSSQAPKRLVLCGHSLGGAVASVLFLRLALRSGLTADEVARMRVVTFGVPLFGDLGLAETARAWGLDRRMHHIVNAGDLTSCLMSFSPHVAAHRLMDVAKQAALKNVRREHRKRQRLAARQALEDEERMLAARSPTPPPAAREPTPPPAEPEVVPQKPKMRDTILELLGDLESPMARTAPAPALAPNGADIAVAVAAAATASAAVSGEPASAEAEAMLAPSATNMGEAPPAAAPPPTPAPVPAAPLAVPVGTDASPAASPSPSGLLEPPRSAPLSRTASGDSADGRSAGSEGGTSAEGASPAKRTYATLLGEYAQRKNSERDLPGTLEKLNVSATDAALYDHPINRSGTPRGLNDSVLVSVRKEYGRTPPPRDDRKPSTETEGVEPRPGSKLRLDTTDDGQPGPTTTLQRMLMSPLSPRSSAPSSSDEEKDEDEERLQQLFETPAIRTMDAIFEFLGERVRTGFLDSAPFGWYYVIAKDTSAILRSRNPLSVARALEVPEGLSAWNIEQHKLSTYFTNMEFLRGGPKMRMYGPPDLARRRAGGEHVEERPPLVKIWAPAVSGSTMQYDAATATLDVALTGTNLDSVVSVKFVGEAKLRAPLALSQRELRFRMDGLPRGANGEEVTAAVARVISHFGEVKVQLDLAPYAAAFRAAAAALTALPADAARAAVAGGKEAVDEWTVVRAPQLFTQSSYPGLIIGVSESGLTNLFSNVFAILRQPKLLQTLLSGYLFSNGFQETLAEAGDMEVEISYCNIDSLKMPAPVTTLSRNASMVTMGFGDVSLEVTLAFKSFKYSERFSYKDVAVKIALKDVGGRMVLRAAVPGTSELPKRPFSLKVDIGDVDVNFAVDVRKDGEVLAAKENWGLTGTLLATFRGAIKSMVMKLVKQYTYGEFLADDFSQALMEQHTVPISGPEGQQMVVDYTMTPPPRVRQGDQRYFFSCHKGSVVVEESARDAHRVMAAKHQTKPYANIAPPVPFDDVLDRMLGPDAPKAGRRDAVLCVSPFAFNTLLASIYLTGSLDVEVTSSRMPKELLALVPENVLENFGLKPAEAFIVRVIATRAPVVTFTPAHIQIEAHSELTIRTPEGRQVFVQDIPFTATVGVEHLGFSTRGLTGVSSLVLSDQDDKGLSLLLGAMRGIAGDMRSFLRAVFRTTVVPYYAKVLGDNSGFFQLGFFSGMPDVMAEVQVVEAGIVVSFTIPQFKLLPEELEEITKYFTDKVTSTASDESSSSGSAPVSMLDRVLGWVEQRVLKWAKKEALADAAADSSGSGAGSHTAIQASRAAGTPVPAAGLGVSPGRGKTPMASPPIASPPQGGWVML